MKFAMHLPVGICFEGQGKVVWGHFLALFLDALGERLHLLDFAGIGASVEILGLG